MTNQPLLLIHAGMRPGELVLAHNGGKDPVFLPACEKPHKFVVGNDMTKSEWAIMRATIDGSIVEPLLIFASADSANAALAELLAALLEPAKDEVSTPSRWSIPIPGPWIAVVAFLALIMILVHLYPSAQTATTDSGAGHGQDSNTVITTTAQTDSSRASIPGPPETQSTFHPSSSTTPAPAAAVSPGDALLRRIRGNH